MSQIKMMPEVDLRSKVAVHDLYRYNRIYSQTSSSSVNLSATSNPELSYEIPTKTLNLSKSYLTFQMDIPAEAALAPLVDFRGTSPIQRVSLYSRSGLYLADIQNVNKYTKMVLPYVTKQAEGENMNSPQVANGTTFPRAAVEPVSYVSWGTIAAPTAYDGAHIGPTDLVAKHDGTVESRPNQFQGVAQYTGGDTVNTAVRVFFHIPLKAFAHTVMSLDRDMFFPEVLILRLQFAQTGDFIRMAAVASPPDMTASAAPTTVIPVTEAYLELAVSTDPKVSSDVMGKVMSSGLSMPVPFVHSAEINLNQASQAINHRVNVGFGQRLLNIYHAQFSGSANLIRHNSFGNVDGDIFSDYYTTLDSQRMQDSNLRSARHEDWNYMKSLIDGSMIQSANDFHENQVHIESFRAGKTHEWLEMDDAEQGLELSAAERTYSLFYNENAALNTDRFNYTFLILQKQLTLNSNGISLA